MSAQSSLFAETPRTWSFRGMPGESSARFGGCDACGRSSCKASPYRYELARKWTRPDGRAGRVVNIGLNCSTADAHDDDPTIRRDIDFADRWGRNELVKLNLFAFRSTDPKGLRGVADPVGPDNDATIARYLDEAAKSPADLVIFSWGGDPRLVRARAAEIVRLARSLDVVARCFGVTKHGQPLHPLYLRKDAPLYRVESLVR